MNGQWTGTCTASSSPSPRPATTPAPHSDCARATRPSAARSRRSRLRSARGCSSARTEGLALTAQGRRLRDHAEAMALAASRAEAAVAARGAAARGAVKLSIGPTLAAHWLMPRMGTFLDGHPHIEIDLITHPFPVSVRRREADIVLRIFETGDENLIGRKIGRLGIGFYASRDYAARHPPAGAPRRLATSPCGRFCRQDVEHRARPLERSRGARRQGGDALLLARRHAGRRPRRRRHLRHVVLRRRLVSGTDPGRAAEARRLVRHVAAGPSRSRRHCRRCAR